MSHTPGWALAVATLLLLAGIACVALGFTATHTQRLTGHRPAWPPPIRQRSRRRRVRPEPRLAPPAGDTPDHPDPGAHTLRAGSDRRRFGRLSTIVLIMIVVVGGVATLVVPATAAAASAPTPGQNSGSGSSNQQVVPASMAGQPPVAAGIRIPAVSGAADLQQLVNRFLGLEQQLADASTRLASAEATRKAALAKQPDVGQPKLQRAVDDLVGTVAELESNLIALGEQINTQAAKLGVSTAVTPITALAAQLEAIQLQARNQPLPPVPVGPTAVARQVHIPAVSGAADLQGLVNRFL